MSSQSTEIQSHRISFVSLGNLLTLADIERLAHHIRSFYACRVPVTAAKRRQFVYGNTSQEYPCATFLCRDTPTYISHHSSQRGHKPCCAAHVKTRAHQVSSHCNVATGVASALQKCRSFENWRGTLYWSSEKPRKLRQLENAETFRSFQEFIQVSARPGKVSRLSFRNPFSQYSHVLWPEQIFTAPATREHIYIGVLEG